MRVRGTKGGGVRWRKRDGGRKEISGSGLGKHGTWYSGWFDGSSIDIAQISSSVSNLSFHLRCVILHISQNYSSSVRNPRQSPSTPPFMLSPVCRFSSLLVISPLLFQSIFHIKDSLCYLAGGYSWAIDILSKGVLIKLSNSNMCWMVWLPHFIPDILCAAVLFHCLCKSLNPLL